ncbi:hypothetical protein OSTOST_15295 [Ostertagia ostertagi]
MTDTKIEDLRLPAAVVSRIVDKAIGPTGTVSKEARTAIARAASLLKAQNVERNVFIGAQRSEERKRKADKKAVAKTTGEDGSFTIAPSEEMRLRTPESDPE